MALKPSELAPSSAEFLAEAIPRYLDGAAVPSTHIRKVSTGSSGSSVAGTVSATCSIGEFSSSSAAARWRR